MSTTDYVSSVLALPTSAKLYLKCHEIIVNYVSIQSHYDWLYDISVDVSITC